MIADQTNISFPGSETAGGYDIPDRLPLTSDNLSKGLAAWLGLAAFELSDNLIDELMGSLARVNITVINPEILEAAMKEIQGGQRLDPSMAKIYFLDEIMKVANELDSRGLYKEADKLDQIIFKQAQASAIVSSVVLPLIEEKYGSWEKFKALSVAKKVVKGVRLILRGAAVLGSQLESISSKHKIPILAWVGSALQIPDVAAQLATSIADMAADIWDRLASLITEKELEIQKSGGQFCINMSDLKKNNLDKSLMLVLSLINPAVSSVIKKSVNAAKNLAKQLPEGSKTKAMLQRQGDAFLASGLCFGKNSDIPAEANSMSKQIQAAAKSKEYSQHVDNAIISDFYMAKNLTEKKRSLPGQPEEGQSSFA